MKCRSCGTSGAKTLLDLGTHYVSGFYDSIRTDIPKAHMALVQCVECSLVQLIETPDQNSLYEEYWYRSNTNPSMVRALKDVVNIATTWAPALEDGDVVLDIACNDGTLLSHYPAGVVRVGIDPSNVAREADCDFFANEFFSKNAYEQIVPSKKAKIITSIAMFYDLPDPHTFAEDVAACLEDDGVWIVQLSYTPLMLDQNAFDNICAEHLEYYTLQSLEYITKGTGFRIADVTLNDTNGGSCCVVLVKNSNELKHVPLYLRQIGQYRLDSYRLLEKDRGYNDASQWAAFANRVSLERFALKDSINTWRAAGKTVYGYGASTKGNTLLQYYDLGPDDITAIAEKQPQKYGKLTAGSWIPIISEDELRAAKPDYVIVFPWHFKDTFLEREKELIESGTKFVFPLPTFEVIG